MTPLLFRLGALYFKKLRWNVIRNRASTKIHRELLFALESARMRLAVAIAVERKSTPPDRWQYYLATSDRMCRFIRKLRTRNFDVLSPPQDWIRALETLRRLPVQDGAVRLSQILGDIVSMLE